MAKDRILAIDIGSSSLKLAEFRTIKGKGLELCNFGVASLGNEPGAEGTKGSYIETTLHELLHEQGIKPGPAVISVAGQSVFSRFVKLPPVEADKVFQMIEYEAQQNVPFPMDEVVWDYQLVGGSSTEEVDVMLAAIKAEIIEEITAAVRGCGLDPLLVDVAPMTLFNTVRFNYGELEGSTLIVDIGARSTDLIFMEGARVFIRSVPVAGNAITQQIMKEFELDFADAESMKQAHAYVSFGAGHEMPGDDVANRVAQCVRNVMTRMHAEINRSINFYRSQQGGSAPSLVLLTGGSAVIPYTDTFLKEKLKVDVDYMNPFLNVSVGSSISEDQIGRFIHQLGEVVGLGLREQHTCPIEINLLPVAIIEERAFKKKVPLLISSIVGLVLIAAVWCFYFYKLASVSEARLDKLKRSAAELQQVERKLIAVEKEYQASSEKISEVLGLAERRTYWLKILDSIHKSVPEGMWITHIRPIEIVEKAPEPEPDRRRRPAPSRGRADAQAEKVAEPAAAAKIEITGKGYIDKIKDKTGIIEFRDSLRKQVVFGPDTEIQWAPAPGPEDYVREFKIVAILADMKGKE